MDARDFYSVFGKLPKHLFDLLLQLKDAFFSEFASSGVDYVKKGSKAERS
ncbi:MAG: hypothetical protein IJO67_08675 [Clostridia bacterium]|nr:hypothetical protein [Clostridia bacterium]